MSEAHPLRPQLPGTRKVGRPLDYETPQELEEWIDMYFDECKANRGRAQRISVCDDPDKLKAILAEEEGQFTEDIHPTTTGLALYLGMSRTALINYEGREEFVGSMKMGKARVETYSEQKLFGNNTNGVKFSLENNFNWKTKNETALTDGEGKPLKTNFTVTMVKPEDKGGA